MIYCENCSSIIDDGLETCPHCGNKISKSELSGVEKHSEFDIDSQIKELNQIVQENTKEQTEQATVSYIPGNSPHQHNAGGAPELPNISRSPSPTYYPNNFATPQPPAYADNDLNIGLKIFISFCSVILPPVGIIIGIILMSGQKIKQRAFGQTTLMYSIILLVIPILCCCILASTGFFANFQEIYYELQNMGYGY